MASSNCNNIVSFPGTKKPRRRGPAPALPRAEVLQIADMIKRDVEYLSAEDTITEIARHVLAIARLIRQPRGS
ncbi:hypothetical protein PQR52_01615 [Paraburkholderia aspalathi]|uniref:hypothetical protein n=1 Tax=Paraburkholderia aspalathi TaxID=1324617 RepID=UPI0038BC288C